MSARSIIPTNDPDQIDESDAKKYAIRLKTDIYTFTLLLLERSNKTGLPLYYTFDTAAQRKIAIVTAFSLIVQFCGLLYFCFITTDHSDDTAYIYNCQSINEQFTINKYYDRDRYYNTKVDISMYNSSFGLNNQKCDIFEDTAAYNQGMTAELFLAKILASLILITVGYIVEDYVMSSRMAVVSPNSRNLRLCILWMGYGLFNAFGIVVSFVKIFVLTNNSDSPIDILTVGISFILLMEIDNKLFDIFAPYCDRVQTTQLSNETLFLLKYSDNQLNNTLYANFSTIDSFDVFIIISCITGALYFAVFQNFFYGSLITKSGAISICCHIFGVIVMAMPGIIIIGFGFRKILHNFYDRS